MTEIVDAKPKWVEPDYTRSEALPFALALSDLFIEALSEIDEFKGVSFSGLSKEDGAHYAFLRREFTRDGNRYAVTIGEGEGVREFGISRSPGEKILDGDIESVVLSIHGQEASVAYTHGALGSGSLGTQRAVNTFDAVSNAYGYLATFKKAE